MIYHFLQNTIMLIRDSINMLKNQEKAKAVGFGELIYIYLSCFARIGLLGVNKYSLNKNICFR